MAEEPQEPGPVPSAAALHRLGEELRARVAGFSSDIDTELGAAADAVADDRKGVAIDALDEQIVRLESFQHDLERIVSDAVVVREAEGVVDAVVDGSTSGGLSGPPGG